MKTSASHKRSPKGAELAPKPIGAFALTPGEDVGAQSNPLPPPRKPMELRANSTPSLQNGPRPPFSSPRAQGTAKARGDETRDPQRHIQTIRGCFPRRTHRDSPSNCPGELELGKGESFPAEWVVDAHLRGIAEGPAAAGRRPRPRQREAS